MAERGGMMDLAPMLEAARAGEMEVSARDLVRAAGGRAVLARMLATRRKRNPILIRQHLHDVLRVEGVVRQEAPLQLPPPGVYERIARVEGIVEWSDSGELVRETVTRMVFDLAGKGGTEEKRHRKGKTGGGAGRPGGGAGGQKPPGGGSGPGRGKGGIRL